MAGNSGLARLGAVLLSVLAVAAITTTTSRASIDSPVAAVPAIAAQSVPISTVDANCDGSVNIADALLVRLLVAQLGNPVQGCNADANRNGQVEATDVLYVLQVLTGLQPQPELPATSLLSSSPSDGESGVAVTRETILEFTDPLDSNTLAQGVVPRIGQQQLAALRHLSPDGKRLTLFYTDPLPPSARVRVTVDGTILKSSFGTFVDGDADGEPGGIGAVDFDTQSLTTVPGTKVCGHVYASELNNGQDVPLVGVTVMVEGMEQSLRTTTNGDGAFCLDPAPAGKFFALVDGRAATNPVPNGAYYPFVGKPWTSVVGETVDIGNVYLPLVAPDALQPVSNSQDTTVGLPQSVVGGDPDLAKVNVKVPAGSLYSDSGAMGGKVGLALVPPDRLPSPLPPGFNPAVVITVQSDGPSNFDRPVPACLPNLPAPGAVQAPAPGSRSALVSFNHDSGRWEVAGSMTVSDDGAVVCTDPGVGINQPGWHASRPLRQFEWTPPPNYNPCPPNSPPPPLQDAINKERNKWQYGGGFYNSIKGDAINAATGNLAGASSAASALAGTNSSVSSQVSTAVSVASTVSDFSGLPLSIPLAMVESGLNLVVSAYETASRALGGCPDARSTGPRALLPQIPDDQVQDQKDLIDAYGDALAVLLNTPQLSQVPENQVDAAREFFDGLIAAMADDGPGGTQITPAEVTSLKAGAIPSPLNAGMVDGMAANWNDWADGGTSVPANQIAQAVDAGQRMQTILTRAEANGWTHPLEVLFDLNDAGASAIDAIVGVLGLWPSHPVYYRVVTNGEAFVVRGLTGPSGQPEPMLVPAETGALVEYLDPETLQIARSFVRPGVAGSTVSIPRAFFVEPLLGDSDGDGLSDDGEAIAGTNPNAADSDGDGIGDAAEIQQGSDPNDGRPVRTGVIATSATSSAALGVCATDDFVAVAQGGSGVSFFLPYTGAANLTSFGRFDTPGNATGVACDGDIVAVADGSAGVAIIDATDPQAATIVHQVALPQPATSVATGSGVFYVAYGQRVAAIDPVTGSLLDSVFLPKDVHDVAVSGDLLLAVTIDKLRLYQELPFGFNLVGEVDVPGSSGSNPPRSVFGGGDYVYIGLSTGQFAGYRVVDISNPAQPVLVGQPSSVDNAFVDLALNGSGLLLGAISIANAPNREIGVYDATDPTVVQNILASLSTPGPANGIAIRGGMAYVADGNAGLQVVNYLPFDDGGVAPSIQLSTSAPGNTVEENQAVVVTADVTDDVQVRTVEFSVNGQVVARDGAYPFEYRFHAPPRSQASSVTVAARAIDTGGRGTNATPIQINITPDTTAPVVRAAAPGQGRSLAPGTSSSVIVFLSEPLDPQSVTNSTFRLFNDGPDGILGNGDDVQVQGAVFAASTASIARINFATPLPGDQYRGVLSGSVTDVAGNPLGTEFSWTFQVAAGLILEPGAFVELSGNLNTPLAEDFFSIVGAPGQTIYLEVVDVRNGECAPPPGGGTIRWTLTRPDGVHVFNGPIMTFCADQGPFTLPIGGSYQLRVYAEGNFTGNYVIHAWGVPQTSVFPIALNQTVQPGVPGPGAGAIESPGAKDEYTFHGNAGDIVYFDPLAMNGGCSGGTEARWSIQRPDNSFIVNSASIAFCADRGPLTLTQTGTYRITVHAGSLNQSGNPSTFTYSFVVRSVPANDVFAIALDQTVSPGNPGQGAGTIEVTGAKDEYTFTANAGQIVYFDPLSMNGGCSGGVDARWSIQEPDGTFLFNAASIGFCNDRGPLTLEQTGTYRITVHAGAFTESGNPDTFTYSFIVRSVPPNHVFAIALDQTVSPGVPAAGAGNIEKPGAKDEYTFTANAGQIVYFDPLAMNGACSGGVDARWSVQQPDGSFLFSAASIGFCNDRGPITLTQSGTYKITVHAGAFSESGNPNTFTYSFVVRSVPPKQVFNISIGTTVAPGSPAAGAGSIEVPGAKDEYTFTVAAGQTAYFDAISVNGQTSGGCSGANARFSVQRPDGSLLVNAASLCIDRDLGALATAGTYRIVVHAGSFDQSGSPDTFTYSFQLRAAP